MPPQVVSRNTIWLYAADIPYVDFEVKQTQIFFHFKNTLSYCIPEATKPAIWPGNAREDGIDLTVYDWSWWLVADDTIELSCSNHGCFGPQFAFYNMERGIQMTFPVSISEAREIYAAAKDMIDRAKRDGAPLVLDETLITLRPSYKCIAYPVKTYCWAASEEYSSSRNLGPVWNPDMS
jgi:hypothetical protein